jgi:hypothetical protein
MSSFEIPATALPRCLENGEVVDPDSPLVLREVVGFARLRAQGGQNHVLFRRETGRFLCPRCAERLKRTGNAGQGGLFDE